MNTTNCFRSLSWLTLGASVAVLTACPQVPPADPLAAPPRITTFSTSQAEVAAGGKVTLSWKVENATSLKIEDVKLGAVSGVEGFEGTVEVAISDASLFVLTARNDRGASDTAVVSVRVGSAAGALLLSALPDTIRAGESATLAWSAPGATSVTLTGAPGGAIDVQGQAATGVVTVSPTATTTYTLTAGSRSITTTVNVQPTLLSFSASSLSADAGSTITLSWATANATRVQLTAPGRGTLLDETDAAKVASGTFDDALPAVVDPGQLFAYELTVTGPGTTLTDSVVVSINGNPAVLTFTAPELSRDPAAGPLADGGVAPSSIRLAWSTREASSVSLTANGVEFYRAPPAQLAAGTLDLPAPTEDTTYVVSARAARGGVATKSAAVNVVGKPTVTLTATPAAVTGGTAVTVAWSGVDIKNASISEVGFGGLYGGTGNTGSFETLPNAATTYSVVVDNGLGDTATATAAVTVTSPITLTVAETGTLRAGQPVNLTWAVPNATASIVGLAHDGVDVRAGSTGFDDISMTGTKLVFPTTGNIVAPLVTSFRTTYFGRVVGQEINVSRYGHLAFERINGANSGNEALPSAKLGTYVVAPYWESLTVGSGVFWQVKGNVLIVQWVMTTANFQAKLYSSGQIDFEYQALPTTVAGHVGVSGSRVAQQLSGTAATGVGLTFFGPRPSPATMRVYEPGPIYGNLDVGGRLLRVSANVTDVVEANQLQINEVMAASPLGANGQWVELRNGRDTAIDLAGWSFGLADGGALNLSGSVPARSVYVVGGSTDPVLNDDAGVQLAVAGFDLTGLSSLSLNRGGAQSIVPIALADAGIAIVNESGPLVGTGLTNCPATSTYGNQTPAQAGTPGRDTGCGAGYALASITPGYFDISDGGTPVVVSSFDDEVNVLDLSAAPVPFFGTQRTAVQISTNGFLTFDTAPASTTEYFTITEPSSTDTNAALVLMGDDLGYNSSLPGSQVYSKRVGAGEDPAASAPHWIVQWHHYSHFGASDDLNFQVKLFDDGVIEYHYATLRSTNSSQYCTGYSAVSWLENEAGTAALSINIQTTNPGLSPNSAFRFVPR